MLFAISALDLLGVNILLLGKRGFFTKKRLVIIGALLVILIITGIGYDIKENTTDIVLKTDLCTVKNVDWVR